MPWLSRKKYTELLEDAFTAKAAEARCDMLERIIETHREDMATLRSDHREEFHKFLMAQAPSHDPFEAIREEAELAADLSEEDLEVAEDLGNWFDRTFVESGTLIKYADGYTPPSFEDPTDG